jgi:hypothetical protein
MSEPIRKKKKSHDQITTELLEKLSALHRKQYEEQAQAREPKPKATKNYDGVYYSRAYENQYDHLQRLKTDKRVLKTQLKLKGRRKSHGPSRWNRLVAETYRKGKYASITDAAKALRGTMAEERKEKDEKKYKEVFKSARPPKIHKPVKKEK